MRELEYLYVTKYYSCGHLSAVPIRMDDNEMWKLVDGNREIHTSLRCKLCSEMTTAQEYKRWEKERKRGEG